MNSFGNYFRITTFGESHGPAIGAVIDGCPPGLELSAEDIQAELDLRRPGQSELTTPRKEADRVEILSGVFEEKTLGTPIALIVFNRDMRPYDYAKIKDLYRPGHADYTYQKKYGRRDYRGGGRSSGRETAARVAAGAVARKLLAQKGIQVVSFARMIGGVWLEEAEPKIGDGPAAANVDAGQLAGLRADIYSSKVRCPHKKTAVAMEQAIQWAAEEQDSLGGIVEVRAYGVPAGLGDPVFGKIDARIGQAVLSLGAVKGIEFGHGFKLAEMRGGEANDRFTTGPGASVLPETNRAGGMAGGISTGLPIICRAVVKPTASIGKFQKSVDAAGKAIDLTIEGRHDPCIVIRIVPVVEHMMNLVLIDLYLAQAALQAWT
ncbi:MAG: chorismate synthase [Spirochaetaceae bacterium]|nr:MAG: chorismate synthase [Spirochaetaceae bacterium]